MKYSYISFFILIFYTQLDAQLLTPYTLYRDQWGVINPASLSNNFTLDEYVFSVAATDRHQWLGNGFNWDYSPNTQLLNFENVQDRNRILIGGHVLQDRTGDLSVLGAYGRFAYLIPMDRFAKKALSVGLAVGVVGLKDVFTGETVSKEEMEPMEAIKHLFEPVVTKSIEPKKAADLPKLVEVLKQVGKEDPSIRVEINEQTGESVMSGMGGNITPFHIVRLVAV